jgi:hypothetical protein
MSSTQTPSGTSAAQVSLTIHDNPPTGVTVLSFEIEVTGASLQPSDSSMQSVSMLSDPRILNWNICKRSRHFWPARVFPRVPTTA